MSNRLAILEVQAKALLACELADFDESTRQMVEDALSKAIEEIKDKIHD